MRHCIIPHLDRLVVARRQQVRLVAQRVVVDMVHALEVVRLEREVRRPAAQTPYLDRAVQTRRREGVCVLWVDRQAHDIVAVAFEDLYALPSLFPIPQLYGHVIGCGEDEGLGRVDDDGADVVGVRLEGGDLLRGVVVVHAELEVIAATHDPVLARDEAAGADGDIGELEGLDDCLQAL